MNIASVLSGPDSHSYMELGRENTVSEREREGGMPYLPLRPDSQQHLSAHYSSCTLTQPLLHTLTVGKPPVSQSPITLCHWLTYL